MMKEKSDTKQTGETFTEKQVVSVAAGSAAVGASAMGVAAWAAGIWDVDTESLQDPTQETASGNDSAGNVVAEWVAEEENQASGAESGAELSVADDEVVVLSEANLLAEGSVWSDTDNEPIEITTEESPAEILLSDEDQMLELIGGDDMMVSDLDLANEQFMDYSSALSPDAGQETIATPDADLFMA